MSGAWQKMFKVVGVALIGMGGAGLMTFVAGQWIGILILTPLDILGIYQFTDDVVPYMFAAGFIVLAALLTRALVKHRRFVESRRKRFGLTRAELRDYDRKLRELLDTDYS